MTPGRGQRVGSSTNSSPITDGNVVVAYFKSGTVACVDLDGKPLWQINLQEKYGKDNLWWDQGTSPVFAGGHVVVAVMQTEGESYMVALDPKTGKEVWKTSRNLKPARNPAIPILRPTSSRRTAKSKLSLGAAIISLVTTQRPASLSGSVADSIRSVPTCNGSSLRQLSGMGSPWFLSTEAIHLPRSAWTAAAMFRKPIGLGATTNLALMPPPYSP